MAKVVERGFERFVPGGDQGDVAGDGDDVAGGIGGCDVGGEGGVDVDDDDFGAFGGEFLRYG